MDVPQNESTANRSSGQAAESTANTDNPPTDNANTAAKVDTPKYVPLYNDLGKDARDVLKKGYNYGLVAFGMHKKTSFGADINAGITYMEDSNNCIGYLASKYVYKDDCAVAARWNIKNVSKQFSLGDNTFVGVLTAKDRFLKFFAECIVDPKTGHITGQLKNAFQDELFSFNLTTIVDKTEPSMINSAVVLGIQGVLVGYQTTLSTDIRRLTKSNFALQYSYKDSTFYLGVNDDKDFKLSVHKKFLENLRTAVQIEWSTDSNMTSADVGVKYDVDTNCSISAKLSNQDGLGLVFRQRFRNGTIITLSSLIDCWHYMQDPKHKFGLAMEVEV